MDCKWLMYTSTGCIYIIYVLVKLYFGSLNICAMGLGKLVKLVLKSISLFLGKLFITRACALYSKQRSGESKTARMVLVEEVIKI